MCNYIKAESLKFLSLNGLYKALINEKEIQIILNLVITILPVSTLLNQSDNLKGLKIKQLSLLSGKSNN